MSENGPVELCVQPAMIEDAQTLVDAAFHMGYKRLGVLIPHHRLEVPHHLSNGNVLVGVIVDAGSVGELKDALARVRNTELVVVRARSERLCRVALESKKTHIVMSPYPEDRLNQVHARLARDNGIAIALSLRACIEKRGSVRSRLLSGYRECVRLWRKFSFPLVLTTEPRDVLDLRCVREVEALCGLFGMEREEVKRAHSQGEQLFKRVRSRLPEGIEVVD